MTIMFLKVFLLVAVLALVVSVVRNLEEIAEYEGKINLLATCYVIFKIFVSFALLFFLVTLF